MKRSRIKRKPRPYTREERAWYARVASIRQCVLCGRHGVQVAHANEGKGMGIKAHYSRTAALCPTCHHEIDNGSGLSRMERRELMDTAIQRTRMLLGFDT